MTETQPLVIPEPTTYRVLEHLGDIYCIAFSPDGKLLATGSQDKTVRIWEVKTGKEQKIIAGETHHIWSVTFSPDGTRLAFGDGDCVKICDVKTGETLDTWKMVGKRHVIFVAFSQDGTSIVCATDEKIVLRLLATGETIWRDVCEKTVGGKILGVSISTHSNRLAYLKGAKVIICPLETGEELLYYMRILGYPPITISSDGTRVAVADYDSVKSVRILDVRGGMPRNSFITHMHDVIAAAFSPDGKFLATKDRGHYLKLRKVDTDEVVRGWHDNKAPLDDPFGTQVAFSPCGRRLAWTSGNALIVLDFGSPNLGAPLSSELEYFLRVNRL